MTRFVRRTTMQPYASRANRIVVGHHLVFHHVRGGFRTPRRTAFHNVTSVIVRACTVAPRFTACSSDGVTRGNSTVMHVPSPGRL